MTPDGYAVELALRLYETEYPSKQILSEIKDVIRQAMEDAWNRGNQYDHGMPYNDNLM